MLYHVSEIAPIAEGEIRYIGEDECIWRFIFNEGEWHEEPGHIVYGDVTEKISKMSRAFHMLVECLKAKQPDCADLCNEALDEFSAAEKELKST